MKRKKKIYIIGERLGITVIKKDGKMHLLKTINKKKEAKSKLVNNKL